MSLKRIVLRDFVIVSELELDLNAGFTVLTGETGAGKSILIDALQLALGSRTDAGVVREGAARADIFAEFALHHQWAPGWTSLGSSSRNRYCSGAPSIPRAKAGPGSTGVQQRQPSCVRQQSFWSRFMGNMPGKA